MLSLKELTINVQFTIYQKKIYKQDKAGVGGRIPFSLYPLLCTSTMSLAGHCPSLSVR